MLHNRLFRAFATLLILAHACVVQAQLTRYLHGGREISSSMVNHIMQDRDGMVWISTDNGLNRMDGAKNTVLYPESGSDVRFNSTFEDKDGRKWICAEKVMLYNPDTEKMTPVPARLEDGKNASFNATHMYQTQDGDILAITRNLGIFRLEEQNGKMLFRQWLKRIPHSYIADITEDKNHNMWVATEYGLARYAGKDIKHVKLRGDDTPVHLTRVIEAKDGNIWCISDVGGAWRVNPRTLKADEVVELRNIPLMSILGEHTDEVLFGSNGQGMWNVDSKTLKVEPLRFHTGNLDSSTLNVHSLLNDKDGNLWVGCFQKGVVILQRQEVNFGYMGSLTPETDLIGSGCVMSLHRDHMGTLWVATGSDGLYAVHGNQSRHLAPAVGKMPNTVMAQATDEYGRLWLGTWMQGLWVMDLKTEQARPFNLPHSGDRPICPFSIKDDGQGNFWVATMGHGIYIINIHTLKVTSIPYLMDGSNADPHKNVLHNRWLNCLALGKNNVMYAATCDGLAAIDVKTRNCTDALGGMNHILGGTTIITLHVDKEGYVWIGTANGLMKMNPKDKSIRRYGQQDGMMGNIIQAITEDKDGTLWISTNLGIISYEKKTDHFFAFYSSNGMQDNEFSKNAFTQAPDGTLYFGGTMGVSSFNPHTLKAVNHKPTLLITALYINGHTTNVSSLSGGKPIMQTGIGEASDIYLDADDNDFVLELSSLNFVQAESTSFEFDIDNEGWQDIPPSMNTISFSNLSYGTHTIKLRAKEWDTYSDERVIKVHIRYPWYLTWWAVIVYLLVIGLIAWTVINHMMTNRQAENARRHLRRQEEINEAKLQFFMNISHEIRTPMTLILSPLQRLMATDSEPERQVSYQIMFRNTQRILLLVNQLLDMRKIDKGQMKLYFSEVELEAYLRHITDSFEDLCKTKNIKLEYVNNVTDSKAWIDPQNFDKIIVNLLSNAFKYSPQDGTITVSLGLTEDKKSYEMTVSDEGIGLDENEVQHVFDRFYQQHCATNNAVQGTGIGLHFAQSLVHMHHGTITAANNGDSKPGCHFTVTLPIGKGHLSESDIDNTPANTQEQPSGLMASSTTETVIAATAPVEELPDDHKRPKTRKRLLIVEDDTEISAYLTTELGRDFIVHTCANGEEALKQIRKQQPDIIISDVMMPVMDGITLVKNIRQNTNFNNTPIVMLTAKTREEDNLEALQVGADAYITKPFNIEILRKTVSNLITRHDQLKNIFKGNQNPEVEKIKVQSPDEKLMKRIMKVINANLDNPNLNNELITREVGISRVHLYRKLKELTNQSLRDFVKNIRLDEAARLLSEKKHSISEIAQRTGFDNVSYFTVVFKQKFGVPPSAYMEAQQREHQNKGEENN